MRTATILLAAFCAALFAAMVWLSTAFLVPGAGGLSPFDARLFGYSPEQALEYLERLDDTGRAVYILEMRLLDTIFPFTLVSLMALVAAWVMQPRNGLTLALTLLPAGAYLLADLSENALVSRMLMAGPAAFDADMARLASVATISKFALLLITVALIARLAWRRRKPD